MLRTRPYDDDSLFQVAFEVTEPIGEEPAGTRHCATFAKNHIEAMHQTRNQYGTEHAQAVRIVEVSTKERERNGTVHTDFLFPRRRRETVVPDDLPEAVNG